MTHPGAVSTIRPPIAPASEPSARLTNAAVTQASPVGVVVRGGREILATAGMAPVSDQPAGLITIWDVRYGRVVRTIRTPPVASLTLVATPDGQVLVAATADDGTIRVWDAVDGRRAWKRRGSPRSGAALGVLADGRAVLAHGVDYAVRVRDAHTGDRLFDLDTPSQRIAAVAIAPPADGRTLIAATAGARVTVWDGTTRARLHVLAGHRLPVAALALHPRPGGGALLAAATAQKVRVWSLPRGELLHTLTYRLEPPLSGRGYAGLAMTGTRGRVLLAYGPVGTSHVWLWDADSGAQQAGVPTGSGPTWGVELLAAPADGDACATIAVTTGGAVELSPITEAPAEVGAAVGAAFAAEPASVDEVPGRVSALAFVPVPGGRALLASAHAGGTLWLREPGGGRVVHRLGTGGEVEALAAPAGGSGILLVAGDHAVRRVDAVAGREDSHHRWTAPPRLGGLALIADERDDPTLVLARALDRLVLWDVRGDALRRELPGPVRTARTLAAARRSDGRWLLASGSYDGAVQLWDLGAPARGRSGPDAPRLLRTLVPHLSPVRAVALAPRPDGRVAVLSGDDAGAIRLWDADSGALLGVRPEVGSPVSALAGHVQPDGRLLVAAAAGTGEHGLLRWSIHVPFPMGRSIDTAQGIAVP